MPLALSEPLRRGQRAFHPGFPQGEPGEASSRLLGRENLMVRGNGARTEPVLVWAETGRTEGLEGTLGGLSGAPALDAQGRVLGVTIAESPRRGRIYTTAPEVVRAALSASGRHGDAGAFGEAITPQNYFYVADDLRRELLGQARKRLGAAVAPKEIDFVDSLPHTRSGNRVTVAGDKPV